MKIFITLVIIISTVYVNAENVINKKQISEQLSLIVGSEKLENLYLSHINDTLFYGQFYPDERFPVFIIENEIRIPILTRDTSIYKNIGDYDVYSYQFNSTKEYVHFGECSLIPLTILTKIIDDKIIENSNIQILDIYDCGLEPYQGYTGIVHYNDSLHQITISCKTKQQFANCNNVITGNVKYDSVVNMITINPIINFPSMTLDAFGVAGGEIKFRYPSDTFQLKFGEDIFDIVIFENKVSIKPDSLTSNILKTE